MGVMCGVCGCDVGCGGDVMCGCDVWGVWV